MVKTPSNNLLPERQILIVDRHSLVRRGLTVLIDNEPDLHVCDAVATQQEAVDAIMSCKPDLVITDFTLVGDDGSDFEKVLVAGRKPVPVLVHTMHDSAQVARKVFDQGALGYVTKQESSDTLLLGIRGVLSGEKFVSEKMKAVFDPE